MITELLSPLILAAAPTIVEVDTTAKYDHEKQVVASRIESKPLGVTYNGTQTYDRTGSPWDADHD